MRAGRRVVLAKRSVRAGVTLVEVMVALIILGVAATGIAGMSFWSGRSSTQAELSAARQIVLDAAAERVGAMSFDHLGTAAGCGEGNENGFEYLLCIRVVEETRQLRRVTVRVAPGSDLVAADSVEFERSLSAPTSPF